MNFYNNRKKNVIIIICGAIFLLCVVVVVVLFISYQYVGAPVNIAAKKIEKTFQEGNCPVQSKQFTVNGGSMAPFIKSGEIIQGLLGYYNCHAIQRGDVVLIHYAGDAYPLIKFVRGVPGDLFSLEQIGNSYALKINGKVVVNSDNLPYRINDSGYNMLSLYANGYHHSIPAQAYLILGDDPNGSLDSERFGLVGESDILGKAVVPHQ